MRIVCVLDESGSMSGSEEKVVQSFNDMISKYREMNAGDAYVSLYTFGSRETPIKLVYTNQHLNEVVELTTADYKPYGSTPLYDAIGRALADHRDFNRVFFVVDTDGFENGSQEYTAGAVRDLIEQKTKDGWDFTFVGADLSQEQTQTMSMNLGMVQGSAMAFDKSSMGYATRSAAIGGKLEAYASMSATANTNAKE